MCGLCGAPLVARPKPDGQRAYVCAAGVGQRGCGKIRCLADPLEAEVRDQVLAALDGAALRQALTADEDGPDLLGELRAAEDQLGGLEVAHFTDGVLSRAGYLASRERLLTRVEAARRALARRDRSGVLADLPTASDALRAAWDGADVEWRRRLLTAVVEAVTVGPAVRGRNVFDPSRVEVRWRA